MYREKPSVSVIIPTYNRYSLLCEAISSVISQNDQDFELIIIDDGSTDGTGDVGKKFQGKLQYHYQKRRGVSAARNQGIRHARGKWICFLDSDDLWHPRKLEIQRSIMEKDPSMQISYTEEIWYRRGLRVNPGKKHAKQTGWIFEHCLPLCIISPSSVMIRKTLFREIPPFDESFPVCEDYDLWLRISQRYPVHLIREPLITKRNGHPGQLSASGWGFDRYRVRSIARLLRSGRLSTSQKKAARIILRKKCTILSQGFHKRGKTAEGKYYEQLCKTAEDA
ncbi:MAG: glycosyltransferase [Deltaproteobacteria bacterium]|nr:glycosyltransferase [Deltaproteobacteria bacterium]